MLDTAVVPVVAPAISGPPPISPPFRLLRLAIAALTLVVLAESAVTVLSYFPVGLDLVIPLNAAERWLVGDIVYVADGFANPELLPPFLYPPFVLPLVAPLSVLPEVAVRWAWLILGMGVGIWVCRRLAVSWRALPFVLLWAPLLDGIWGGNVQLFLFAPFVAVFWRAPDRYDHHPKARDLHEPGGITPRLGWLAAAVATLKVTQAHAWLALLGRSPRAALLGLVPWVALVVVTLPLVGVELYGAWLQQAARASDPAWRAMGQSLLQYVPGVMFIVLTLLSFALALVVRGRDAGVWIGLLILLVTPNMHVQSALFLLPAMLRIRMEFALLAAMLTSTHTTEGWWFGIAIVIGVMLAGERWSILREPPSVVRAISG